jgi:hypothetical protein
MTYPVTSQKRELHSYSMDAIPDGLYMDHNSGKCFVSARRLAKLVDEFEDTINEFIEADYVLEEATEITVIQTALGLRRVRLHPESTVKAVVKAYKPDLFIDLEGCNFDEFLDGLAKFATDLVVDSIPSESQTEWTLQEWMISYCEIPLDGRLFNQFKSKVHRAYKETYRRDPRTSYRKQANNPKQVARLQVYNPSEFPILQLCYMKTLMEVRCQ